VIVAFIAIALIYVMTGGGVEQLTANDGFTPKGGMTILSGVVIVAIMPWSSAELGKSPFATTLDESASRWRRRS
jgi:L-asparagine transporter-like permease